MKSKTVCPHCEDYCNAHVEVYGIEFHLIETGYRPHQEMEITRAWRKCGTVIDDKSELDDMLHSLYVDVNSGMLTI